MLVHLKIRKGKEMRGWSVESDNYGQEWNDESLRGPHSIKLIPKGDQLPGHNVNHQVKHGKEHNAQANIT